MGAATAKSISAIQAGRTSVGTDPHLTGRARRAASSVKSRSRSAGTSPTYGRSESRRLEGRHAPVRPHHETGVRGTSAQPLVRATAEGERGGRLDVGPGE